ncbi:MAG: TA system VapC family ribonuclease toxin [Rhodoblastus sp.]
MTLADVNVLIYAFRADARFHAHSYSWLTKTADLGRQFCVSTLALAALVRITTAPSLADGRSSAAEAFDFCDSLLTRDNCVPIEPGARHWKIFRDLCKHTPLNGKRTTDAWYAALAIEHDCEFITYDRDFARFPGLRWRTPE